MKSIKLRLVPLHDLIGLVMGKVSGCHVIFCLLLLFTKRLKNKIQSAQQNDNATNNEIFHPKDNNDITCWHIYQGEGGGKSGQEEDCSRIGGDSQVWGGEGEEKVEEK